MKLGLDIHGVINENPGFFKALCQALILDECNENEVHIITGPSEGKAKAELAAMGFQEDIHYTKIYSIVEHHQRIGTPMKQDTNGNWHTVKLENGIWVQDQYPWDRTKADYCLQHGIDLMIDDSDIYAYFFRTPYARFFSKNKRTHHIVQGEIK